MTRSTTPISEMTYPELTWLLLRLSALEMFLQRALRRRDELTKGSTAVATDKRSEFEQIQDAQAEQLERSQQLFDSLTTHVRDVPAPGSEDDGR